MLVTLSSSRFSRVPLSSRSSRTMPISPLTHGGVTMPRWSKGEAVVESLVRSKELEHVSGAAADGASLLETAQKTVATAAALVQDDARSAYVLAYDAARLACSALLTQQGMRATSKGRTMPLSRWSGLSSAIVSGHSPTCGAAETNSSTRTDLPIRRPRTKLSRLLRKRSSSSRRLTAS